MQTGTGSGVQIVPPADEVGYEGLTFSPDGDHVYYVRRLANNPAELYRVPTLGGTPKRLLVDLETAVEFSPDGRQIAFVRDVLGREPLSETRLMVANADGTAERVVATRKAPARYGVAALRKVACSPDGEYIAFPAGGRSLPGTGNMEVVAVSVKDGSERSLTSQNWFHIKQVAWLRDGSGLVLVGRDQPTASSQVWLLSYPGGELRRLSNDFSSYDDVSVTADSSTIVTVQGDRLSNIWVAPDADAARARQIGDSREDGFQGVAWTPDGRALAYIDHRHQNVWLQPIDGGSPRQLTDFKTDQTFSFAWSRDGRQTALARGSQTSDVVTITDFK